MMRKDSLTRMAEVRGEWCVSIYMSIVESETKENRKRLKNLTAEAARSMIALGVAPLKTARMLGPVEMILENAGFWADRKEGFAAFFTPDSFVWYSIPYQFDELVVVTDRFHLKPLVRSVSQNRRFNLLALGKENTRFFEASELGIDEINLKGIPKYTTHLFKGETQDDQQNEERTPAGEDFSTGNQSEAVKSALLSIYRRVDLAITAYLKDDEAPLVVVGEELFRDVYRKANSYAHLSEMEVGGEADRLTPKELLQKAMPLIKPVFRAKREDALQYYRDNFKTGLATNDLPKIFKAAGDGRIETLFVPVGRQKWGKFDRQTGELEIHRRVEPGDKDLLCVASTRTLLKGGEVFVVLPEQMPDESAIAAVLRR